MNRRADMISLPGAATSEPQRLRDVQPDDAGQRNMSSALNGWVKLHRTLLDHPRSRDPEWLSIWIHILLNAAFTPMRTIFNGKEITLKPGQLVVGRYLLAKSTGVHPSKVKRTLKVMESDQQIDLLATAKGSLITVLNWQLYQNGDLLSDHSGDHSTDLLPTIPVTIPVATLYKKEKNGKNEITQEKEEGECPPLPEEALFWNENGVLSKVLAMSRPRETALTARHKDPFFVANWKAAIEKLRTSQFCLGKNDRGWVATFDWFLRPDTVARIMEGKYDGTKPKFVPEANQIQEVIDVPTVKF